MLKINKYLLFLAGLSLLVISISCNKEDVEPRTRELELAELDIKLKALEAKGVDIDTTSMSVFYYVIKPGEGAYPKVGDSCLVSYIGFLPNGSKLEDSREIHPPDGIWRFNYKPPHKVIGLVNGIGYLNEGAEAEMYITSDNAYGSKGNSTVPPYTTLIYRVKMHNIIPKE